MVSSVEVRKMKEEGNIDGLFEALEAEERWVREAALDALLKVGDEAAREKLLERTHKQLAEKDGGVVDQATIALGKIGSKKSVQALLGLLDHEMPQVVRHAAEALGKIGDPQALEKLLPLLAHANNQVRVSTVEALAGLKDPRACPALLERLDTTELEAGEVVAILRALASLGDPQAGDVTAGYLEHKSISVRQSAARILTEEGVAASLTKKEQAVAGLVGMLKMFTADIRISVCKALAVVGNEDAIPALEHVRRTDNTATMNPYTLEVQSYEVREEAERAIKKIQERLAK